MLVVGLTGNIGSGKSTVAGILEARGVPLIDADLLAREAVAPGAPALAAIAERFGRSVLTPAGALDRAALRAIVFANPADRASLDAIVHPAVKALRDARLADLRARRAPIVVCDIPLLFETGLDREVDVTVLVDAPLDVRLARILRNRGLSRDEALAMAAAQLPAEDKRARADYVIENDGSIEELRERVNAVWTAIDRDRLS